MISTAKIPAKIPANACEAVFDEFVLWYGGEQVEQLLPRGQNKPKNADYLFEERSVIAELKCLQKEYFSNPSVSLKAKALIENWLKEGGILNNNINGGAISIPSELAPKIIDIFKKPVKAAIEEANRQIKITKEALGLPFAKGLLILINEQNSALTPNILFYMLANIFNGRYSQIDSFVYAVPTMKMQAASLPKAVNLWVSGNAHKDIEGVSKEALNLLQQGWIDFINNKFGQKIETIKPANHGLLEELNFTRY